MLHTYCLAQLRVSKSTHLMAKTLANHGPMTQADVLFQRRQMSSCHVPEQTILNVTTGNRSYHVVEMQYHLTHRLPPFMKAAARF